MTAQDQAGGQNQPQPGGQGQQQQTPTERPAETGSGGEQRSFQDQERDDQRSPQQDQERGGGESGRGERGGDDIEGGQTADR